jgi:hypothetical protein
MMDWLEYWHNRASDTRFVWFPFEKLRPASHELLLFKPRVIMSLCFGLYYGLFYLLRKFLIGVKLDDRFVVDAFVVATLGFFIWFNLVTAFFWNRRARRLRKKT